MHGRHIELIEQLKGCQSQSMVFKNLSRAELKTHPLNFTGQSAPTVGDMSSAD